MSVGITYYCLTPSTLDHYTKKYGHCLLHSPCILNWCEANYKKDHFLHLDDLLVIHNRAASCLT